MNHVFGKRNKPIIFLRKCIAFFYSRLTSIFRGGSNEYLSKSKSIYCYPPFKSDKVKADVLNRFAWSFPEKSEINIFYSDKKDSKDLKTVELANQCNYISRNNNIESIPIANLSQELKASSLIAIHDKKSCLDFKLWPYLGKCKIVDPTYFSLEEGNFWKFGYYNMLSEREKNSYRNLSINNFNLFSKKYSGIESAYIFVTGPSFGRYKDFEYKKDSIKIVCNTIIKDSEFLDFIDGPDVITFADPVFHFSSNNYACEFRKLVIDTVKKYNSYIAVPQSTVPLLIQNYPELQDKIIGLRKSETLNFPSLDNLSVKPSGSIITFIMIPLAGGLVDEVFILGADGRGKKENYFWKHNNKVQLTEYMDSVFHSHPSFFRDRSYSDHYSEHCNYLESLILYGESNGKRFFSITESYVPALKERLITSE